MTRLEKLLEEVTERVKWRNADQDNHYRAGFIVALEGVIDLLDAAIKAEAEERGRTPDLKEAARDLLETIRCAEVVKRGIRYLYTRDEAVAMLESALMRAAEVRRKLEARE